ncbi:pseudouridine synthase [Thalassotalea sp. PLHSN55]|uniref:pseudouridine synthase n=1 Tax=Thalassotalea sp. PLHSN55 TaxID=3435888 RepID=UPI003F87AF54
MAANPDFVYQPPMSPYLDIIYQDEELVVVNKPSGLLTVPGRLPEHQDCLQNRVNKVLPTATIVHRLDMATSGLLIMALTKPAHVAISRQFEKRKINKTYIARVYGTVEQAQGEVNLPLICDWPNRPKQMVDHQRGKPSTTLYKRLDNAVINGHDTSLVELTPITGRSHQLRVHMLSLGHPILGDRLYAHPQALALSNRLQLHAKEISFFLPSSNERITFSTPCPF